MLLAHGAGGEKSDSFSRRGEQDRSALWNRNRKQVSCNCSGGTIATKYYLTENPAPRKNGLPHPAKGGSTPAFACQYAAIAPLPCSNLQPWFSWFNFVWIGQFWKMQLQQEKHICKYNLLRKCGLLAHTSAAFLKNCCTEKLFICLRLVFLNGQFLQKQCFT